MKNGTGTSDSNTKKHGTAIRSTAVFFTQKIVLFSDTRCCSADTDHYCTYFLNCLYAFSSLNGNIKHKLVLQKYVGARHVWAKNGTKT
jgi:hypothetical protein